MKKMIVYSEGVMFSKDNKRVALILKNRPKWQFGLYNTIGGKVEENETPLQAMVREFEEETGAKIPESRWIHALTLVSEQFNAVVHFFKCSDNLDLLRTITDEKIYIVDDFVSDLPTNVVPNIRWIIPLLASDLIFPITILQKTVV